MIVKDYQRVRVNLGKMDNQHQQVCLQARSEALAPCEKHVVMLIDEIYTSQRVEYHNGKVYGLETEAVSKTILAFMKNSIADKYHDVGHYFLSPNWTVQS